MSYQMIHNAVTEAVNEVGNKDHWGFSIGDKVHYKMICQYIENGKQQRVAYHDATVRGFTEKTVKIEFSNGYCKFVRHDQLEKI